MSQEEDTETMDVSGGNSEAPEESQVSNVRSYSMSVIRMREPVATNSGSIQQPQQPRSLQDLLRYSVEAKDPGSGNVHEDIEEMSKEKADFLMAALKSMTVSEIEEVMKALETVKQITTSVTEEELPTYLEALDLISDFVHGIDVANDFSKYGGLETMHKVLCLPHKSLQLRAAGIIGNCVQNNPVSQRYVLRVPQLLPDLIKLIDTAPSPDVKLKALYAVSCIVRDNPCAVGVFHQHGGFETVKKVLAMDVDKLVVKASYLVTALSGQDKKIKDHFVELEFVQDLISLIEHVQIQSNRVFILEALVVALHSLLNNNGSALEMIKSSGTLKSSLQEIIKSVKGDEAYLELMRCAMDLLKICEVSAT